MLSDAVKELNSIWERVLGVIKDSGLDRHIFDTFFASTQIHSIQGNNFLILTDTNFVKENFEKVYSNEVLLAIKQVTQTDYGFIIKTRAEFESNKPSVLEERPFFENSKLNTNLTFDSFVPGQFNIEAYQASLMIADNPGKMYNPLFIYSDSGLGKTHLLHAIGNFIKNKMPKTRILYITANDFVDEYIDFVRNKKGDADLKKFFRGVDVFLVDDVQFLAGKAGTEEMFFNIFNSLVRNDPGTDKQIVLTSDKHPLELKGLEQRLVTRFQSGLTVNISRPDVESAKSILKKKIQAFNLEISRFDDDVLTLYAERFSSNIRELEGALNRLVFYAINTKSSSQITMEVALESLGNMVKYIDDNNKLNANKIINTVADFYNISPNQLTGKNRISQITIARHVAMYLIRFLLDIPLATIGHYFGNAHHTTVMNGVDKIEKMLKSSGEMRDVISALKKRLKA